MDNIDFKKTGKVESISDGICLISGIESVAIYSVVSFPSGALGLVIDFSEKYCNAIVFGDFTKIKKGDYVKVVNQKLEIPVGDEYLGRIINPLGNPIDDKGKINPEYSVELEQQAKSVFERRQIDTQLETGFLLVDSQIPIGLGQRELFIGERRIGKEDLALSLLINQHLNQTNVKVIYVTIGAQTSFIRRSIEKITNSGALKNSIFIVGRASDSAPLNYIAPYTGLCMAEHLAKKGENVLVIFDNLTRHARIYRQISLLLKRAPGREAYPGDIFYLHSRLLERAGCFNEKTGNGSITAIPLVETISEDITDYITTNLMSITDGHIHFTRALYHQDRRPAINTEYSVSRIGGKAQRFVFRELSNDLKSLIGKYNEIESLTSFGTELQQDTLTLIERGKRVYSFTNQDQTTNLPIKTQSLIIYLLLSDHILKWPFEIMTDLSHCFFTFIKNQEIETLIEQANQENDLEKAKTIYENICQKFLKDPATIKPIDQDKNSSNNQSVTDLLKGMEKNK